MERGYSYNKKLAPVEVIKYVINDDELSRLGYAKIYFNEVDDKGAMSLLVIKTAKDDLEIRLNHFYRENSKIALTSDFNYVYCNNNEI